MYCLVCLFFFFFKQKTAYEMRISDWSSDVCSSDLDSRIVRRVLRIVPHRDGGGSLLIGRSFLPPMDDVGRGRSHPLLRRVRLHPLYLGRRHLHPSLHITGFDLAEHPQVSLILVVAVHSPITTESVHHSSLDKL